MGPEILTIFRGQNILVTGDTGFNRHFPFAASEATILLHPRLISKPNCGFDENACL